MSAERASTPGCTSGAIGMLSAPGKGSTFLVSLACEPASVEKDDARVNVTTQDRSCGGTVLLVEDEETLRMAICLLLEKNGFVVIATGDGHSAVDLFRQREQEIDVALLDVTLPGLSGAEVYRELRRIKPQLKIVLTSAYDRDRISADFGFEEDSRFHFIRKPYRISDLVRNLQDGLSSRSGGINPAAEEAREH